MKQLTLEQKAELLQDYNNREIGVRELEAKYNLNRTDLCHLAVELGATPRRPSVYGTTRKKGTQTVACPKCKKRIEVKGARFCPYCGSDVRSEKDKLCERLENAIQYVNLLPTGSADEVRDTILDTIKELKRK